MYYQAGTLSKESLCLSRERPCNHQAGRNLTLAKKEDNGSGEAWDQGFSGCYLDKHNQPLPEGITSETMGLSIPTPEGVVVVGVMGDYIIKGVKGEFYPCKPDIFEVIYELVEE